MHGPPPSADDQQFRALKASLTNQAPSAGQVERIERVRAEAIAAGAAIIGNCPASAERTLALRKLEEATMWAVKSIVLPRES